VSVETEAASAAATAVGDRQLCVLLSLQGSVLLVQISWHAVATANSIGLSKYK